LYIDWAKKQFQYIQIIVINKNYNKIPNKTKILENAQHKKHKYAKIQTHKTKTQFNYTKILETKNTKQY